MRAPAVLGLAGALALLAANLLQLTGWAYARRAETLLDRGSPAALQAARNAATLDPASSARLALIGWTAGAAGLGDESDTAYARALRWSPADPVLWAEYAQALARRSEFDRMTLPTRRADALAPFSPAVQSAIAGMGISYWDLGSEDLRAPWLRAMQYERRHNSNLLLYTVLGRGRVASFCAGPAAALKAGRWCRGMERAAEICREQTGSDERMALCVRER